MILTEDFMFNMNFNLDNNLKTLKKKFKNNKSLLMICEGFITIKVKE